MKELSTNEITEINGGFWVRYVFLSGVSIYNAHRWYQSSGMINHDVDVGIAP